MPTEAEVERMRAAIAAVIEHVKPGLRRACDVPAYEPVPWHLILGLYNAMCSTEAKP